MTSGDKIQATCKRAYLVSLGSKCVVGEWKKISNFSVTDAKGHYRTTKHSKKITFINLTKISDCNYHNKDMFLSLMYFEKVLSGNENTSFLIACCIWGKFAEMLEPYSEEAQMGVVVCLIKFAKIYRIVQGILQVSNRLLSIQQFKKLTIGKKRKLSIFDDIGITKFLLLDVIGNMILDESATKILNGCQNPSQLQPIVIATTREIMWCWRMETSGLNRHTSHVFKMEFVKQTLITDANLACHNMSLDLQDFANIINGLSDPCFLIDVYITNIFAYQILRLGGLNNVQGARKEMTKLEFTLRDINDMRLQCCITGKLAEILTREGKQPDIGDVCLIRFAKIGSYNAIVIVKLRELCVSSNAFNSTLLLINPDIKEAQALKQMRFPFRTIQEMKRCYKDRNCRVICSVYAIDTVSGWYYLACVVCHNKSISFDEKYVLIWWCEFCQCGVTKVSAMYKLDLLVQDQTGKSKFTLQDSVATSIVEVREMLPPELVEIVGKTYGFGISVDENKTSSEVEKFSAMKVWSLNDIMLKRIKSLHHDSTYSRKNQCTNVIKTDKLHNDEGEDTKSG
ncbi:LOW QUALITY PROTEIN: hypothetical protein HID58_081815 [Brassica napus]|uniref:Replication protein A 70 kDa DNA-binding subunit B/D first OB fold domain-containing protein n=2 Tax=Brassica napus TaxID=3708 RepID=A0ABQ7Y8W4_BRANA|nr:LOW QUALITY PROTEIN: hypothetical protein HID58_081815 [Brassica napus]